MKTTSQTIKNFTNISKRTNNLTTFHAGMYSILCNDCDKYYIDETQGNFDKRIFERSFFQAAVTSILLYGCTTWTLTKRLEKKLDGNYTRMLRAILNKSWQQHPTRHQLYGHLPPITKTIQVRRTRHAGHCWRSRDELIRDVLLWIPTHGRAKAGRPARTYIQQLCEDTGCCPEDLPRAMNDREEWRERVRDIRAASTIWWWWWWNVPLKCPFLPCVRFQISFQFSQATLIKLIYRRKSRRLLNDALDFFHISPYLAFTGE